MIETLIVAAAMQLPVGHVPESLPNRESCQSYVFTRKRRRTLVMANRRDRRSSARGKGEALSKVGGRVWKDRGVPPVVELGDAFLF